MTHSNLTKMVSIQQLPAPHRTFIEEGVPRLERDERLLGVAVGGSFLLNEIDVYSDLDLVVFVEPSAYQGVLRERDVIAASMGDLLESFTGEHVGEPRLLICLYGPPLLHVDLKFVSLEDIHDKVEDPVVLWERDDRISTQLFQQEAVFPQPRKEWIEKRFWVWVHYTATKIGRGELFEAIEALGFLRVNVLGPLILEKQGARPQGLRKIERHAKKEQQDMLKRTLAGYDDGECLQALQGSIELYRAIRTTGVNPVFEKHVLDYLQTINPKRRINS